MARRHLQYGIDEWEALPWWQQQVHLEGMQEEFFEDDSYIDNEFDDELEAAASFGVTVRNVS